MDKRVSVSVTVPESVKLILEQEAKKMGMTRSALGGLAIEKYLKVRRNAAAFMKGE